MEAASRWLGNEECGQRERKREAAQLEIQGNESKRNERKWKTNQDDRKQNSAALETGCASAFDVWLVDFAGREAGQRGVVAMATLSRQIRSTPSALLVWGILASMRQ